MGPVSHETMPVPQYNFKEPMRVALIHDYLNQIGGAERVLEALLELFPSADLYTLLYSKDRTRRRFDHSIRGTSFLDFALARRYHRPFIPLMPLAIHHLDLQKEYDLIISDSAGYAKGIRKDAESFHLCYCYTPLRYAWEPYRYITNSIVRNAVRPACRYLRRWDLEASQKPNKMLAVSRHIAEKIQTYYGRDCPVLYPPVDYATFYHEKRGSSPTAAECYYLAVGRLLPYKRFDLVIDSFRQLGAHLKIVGAGPEKGRILRRIASCATIEYLPFVTDAQLRTLYNGARALIFPQVEDFGLVAAEAQACGTPVLAFRAGGAREIVLDGITGLFFERQTAPEIIDAVRRFEARRWNRLDVSNASQRFSIETFKVGVMDHVNKR